jgi:hypothetical protein
VCVSGVSVGSTPLSVAVVVALKLVCVAADGVAAGGEVSSSSGAAGENVMQVSASVVEGAIGCGDWFTSE